MRKVILLLVIIIASSLLIGDSTLAEQPPDNVLALCDTADVLVGGSYQLDARPHEIMALSSGGGYQLAITSVPAQRGPWGGCCCIFIPWIAMPAFTNPASE